MQKPVHPTVAQDRRGLRGCRGRLPYAGRAAPARQAGMGLLEMLVAFAIMALSLGLIYQIMGSNLKTAALMDGHQRATVLVQSLLHAYDAVPEAGWNATGQSAGMDWQVRSQPYETPVQRQYPQAVPLHALDVQVSWPEDGRVRHMAVRTLRPQRKAEELQP